MSKKSVTQRGIVIGVVGGTKKSRKRFAGKILIMRKGPSAILLDYLDLSSHKSMTKENMNRTHGLWGELKRGRSIIWTAPFGKDIDKRVRFLSDVVIVLDNRESGILVKHLRLKET